MRWTALKEPDWSQFRALAIDMDGTLAGADHRVTPRTIRALKRAEREGLPAIIVTGRAYPTALDVWEQAQLSAPIITCGGALMLQPPDLVPLYQRAIPRAAVEAALNVGSKLGLEVSLWTPHRIWMDRPGPFGDLLGRINQMPTGILGRDPGRGRAGDVPPHPDGPAPVVKVMFCGTPERMDQVEAAILDSMRPMAPTIARAMPYFIEFTHPDASKKRALQRALDKLGVLPEQVVAIGDGGNDVEMLRDAGWGVSPANGMPEVKAVADQIIGHHDDEGVAQFIEYVLDRRRSEAQDHSHPR